MPLEKGLILKGIAGVVAVAGGGVSVAYGTGAFSSRKDEINKKLRTLGLGDCVFTDNEEVGKTFSKECKLDQDKFKKINFSNKGGEEKVNVAGWTNDNITLKIENKDDGGIKFTFNNPPSDLTITGDNTKGTITIKKQKETEFEENSEGKLGKVIDESLKSKLDGYNSKFENLSLPETCRFDVTDKETSIECDVTDTDLKKIKFSNKGEGELQLTGLNSGGKIKLKIVRDTTATPETLKYKFKNENSDKITISGKSDEAKIVLKTNTEREFKEESERLVKSSVDSSLSEKLKVHNKTLETLSLPEGCRFDDTEDDTSFECDISEENMKKINFSNKGTEDLKINNWESNGNIKLKGEHESASSEMRISFTGVSQEITILGEKTKGKIVLKNSTPTKKFKVEGGKLTKDSSNPTDKTKYQGFNKQLGDLDVPVECRFDEGESDSTVTCQITKEQLKKIKFWNKGEGDLTIEEDTGFTTANLEVKKDNKGNLKLVFKDLTKTVKVKGDGNNSFNLRKSSNNHDEFEVRNNVLGQVRKLENKEVAGLTCTYSGNGNSGTCKPKNNQSVRVFVSNGDCKGEVTLSNCQNGCFNFSEYEDGYNLTTKFTYTGENEGTNGLQLEKNADYDSVNKEDSAGVNKDYLTKKNSK